MVNLRKVTSKNFDKIIKLKADEKFVAPNLDSLAEAYTYYIENGVGPLAYGIYNDETPVGFIMAGYFSDSDDDYMQFTDGKPFYYLWRMMLDNGYQNKGYGRQALSLLMQEIVTFPLGKAEKMFTSVEPENAVAYKFYESFGFAKTGVIIEGEEVMQLEL